MSDQPAHRYAAEDFRGVEESVRRAYLSDSSTDCWIVLAALRMAAAVETPGLIEEHCYGNSLLDGASIEEEAQAIREAIRKGAKP